MPYLIEKAMQDPNIVSTLRDSLIEFAKDVESKSIYKGRAGSAAEKTRAGTLWKWN